MSKFQLDISIHLSVPQGAKMNTSKIILLIFLSGLVPLLCSLYHWMTSYTQCHTRNLGVVVTTLSSQLPWSVGRACQCHFPDVSQSFLLCSHCHCLAEAVHSLSSDGLWQQAPKWPLYLYPFYSLKYYHNPVFKNAHLLGSRSHSGLKLSVAPWGTWNKAQTL